MRKIPVLVFDYRFHTTKKKKKELSASSTGFIRGHTQQIYPLRSLTFICIFIFVNNAVVSFHSIA